MRHLLNSQSSPVVEGVMENLQTVGLLGLTFGIIGDRCFTATHGSGFTARGRRGLQGRVMATT